jgi:DNA polymerase-1
MSALSIREYHESRQGKTDKMVLVMDGDWLVFQAMAASEVETQWDEDTWSLECDHKKAWGILNDSIKSYASRKKSWAGAPIVMAFTDSVNWRKELVDSTYKENRKGTRKPVGYRAFVERVQACTDWTSILESHLEGDDVMGIIGSGAAHFGFEKSVLVSCDKDFKTIPDCDFLWCTTGNILKQDISTANYWHIFQTIKGDLTDGYSGIPGWGDTTADWLEAPYAFEQVEKIFKSGPRKGQTVLEWRKVEQGDLTLWDCIVTLGARAGMTEQEIIKQGQMARILRFDEYNFDTKEVTLWTPTVTWP